MLSQSGTGQTTLQLATAGHSWATALGAEGYPRAGEFHPSMAGFM